MCTSEGVQGGGRSKPGLILLDFWQTGPVDPDFFGQEPSLDCKDSFEPKSSFLDQMVQKLRAYKGLYVFPFPGLIYRYLDCQLYTFMTLTLISESTPTFVYP